MNVLKSVHFLGKVLKIKKTTYGSNGEAPSIANKPLIMTSMRLFLGNATPHLNDYNGNLICFEINFEKTAR